MPQPKQVCCLGGHLRRKSRQEAQFRRLHTGQPLTRLQSPNCSASGASTGSGRSGFFEVFRPLGQKWTVFITPRPGVYEGIGD